MGPLYKDSIIIFATRQLIIIITYITLIVAMLAIFFVDIDTVFFDGDDGTEGLVPEVTHPNEGVPLSSEDKSVEDKATSVPSTNHYEKNSKWYVERMKFAYDQLMEHESK